MTLCEVEYQKNGTS